jgi:hypothetical protein
MQININKFIVEKTKKHFLLIEGVVKSSEELGLFTYEDVFSRCGLSGEKSGRAWTSLSQDTKEFPKLIIPVSTIRKSVKGEPVRRFKKYKINPKYDLGELKKEIGERKNAL